MKGTGLVVVDFQVDFRRYVSMDAFNRLHQGIPALQQAVSGMSWWNFTTMRSNRRDAPFFKSRGGSWWDHCVIGTNGIDSYSPAGWVSEMSSPPQESLMKSVVHQDGGRYLVDSLRRNSVKRLVFCGFGTEYGIRSTVLDALKEGFKVDVVNDLCEAYNLESANDGIDAILDMEDAGATLLTSAEVIHGRARLVERPVEDENYQDDDYDPR